MSAYTGLVASLLFPLHETLKGHSTVNRLRELEATQWWSPERLGEHRIVRLREFLEEIARNVPYFREAFARLGLQPRAVSNMGDLAAYPLLNKPLIRANTETLRSERAGTLKRYNTGGSSGEPLVFYMGKDRISHDVAAKWRATRWWNVDIGDREIVVWGSPLELGLQDGLRSLRDVVFRSELLPAFEMSEANLNGFVDRIRARRPAMLFGYPSSLYLIAAHARKCERRLDDLGIRVAFVTSERLYEHQRTVIEEVFGCPTANGYGGRDAGFIAHQCPLGGMHISAEDIIVEIIGVDGKPVAPGCSGEIVVTHLATQDFPFLRYRTGDVGALDAASCRCGRGLPLLKELQGRSTDFVVAADGQIMHGLALIYTLRDLPGIAQFKITQESRTYTRVQIVAAPDYHAAVDEQIRTGLRSRLGACVQIDVQRESEIAPDRSGKYRYVVSHLAHAS